MPSTGFVLPASGTTSDTDFPPVLWSNPSNITNSSTANWATLSTGFIILNVSTQTLVLVNSGVQQGNNISMSDIWPTLGGFQTIQYGGALSVYGLNSTTMTPAIVNSSTFGVRLTCQLDTSSRLIGTNFAVNYPSAVPIDATITEIYIRFSRREVSSRTGQEAQVAWMQIDVHYELPNEGRAQYIGGGYY